MIDQALFLLKAELTDYLQSKKDLADVIVDNVGLLETANGTTLIDNVIITLVNIEEESTLKNQPALKRPFSDQANYTNPPIYLNLYVLLSCNYSGDKYRLALKRLSHVIRFLQSKNTFSTATTVATLDLDLGDTDGMEVKFTLDLYTLTFEQINHLWGSLGGRQIPFALYKLKLVGLTENQVVRQVPLIEEIVIDI